MDLIVPDWIGAPDNVRAISTTRIGGVSLAPYHDGTTTEHGLNTATHVGDNPDHVLRNRIILRSKLPVEPVWLNQVHGSTVIDAAQVNGIPDADAGMTTGRRIVCVVQTADCLPVLFCDKAGRTVAAAHAGWRGLAAGILEHTVQKMRSSGADAILAWMGPAIGPDHFEVGEDVLDAFESRGFRVQEAFRSRAGQPGKYLADIYALAREALGKVGVNQVSGGGFCTVADFRRFYSFRRDGVTGRMASLIWLE